MQVDIKEIIGLMGSGYAVGILLSFAPWCIGTVIGIAINTMRK